MPRRAMNHLPLLQRKSIAFLDVYTREKNPLWILCTLVPQLIPLRTITPLGTMWYEESTPWVKVTIVPCKYWRNWATHNEVNCVNISMKVVIKENRIITYITNLKEVLHYLGAQASLKMDLGMGLNFEVHLKHI